jgi:tagatose 1,6-diphosphate aldolase
VQGLLDACHDPLTLRLEPAMAGTTRQQILAFLAAHPQGHQAPQPQRGWAPTYHFWMRLHDRPELPSVIAGGIGLRIGHSKDLEYYTGHVGYHVYPAARGHHYAERACRLLLPLARRHGLTTLWITCNPDNLPSRRTCQRLGAELIEIVALPEDHTLYAQGERLKCRYRLAL